MSDVSQESQDSYAANVEGWSKVAGIKADQQHLNRISAERQAAETKNQNVASASAFESARALGEKTADKMVAQEAEKSRLAKVRESIAKMFRKPDKPTATTTPQVNPA